MDKFVEKAFADALNAISQSKDEAMKKHIVDGNGAKVIMTTAALQTGIEKMDKLLANLSEENLETLGSFISNVICLTFQVGYTARLEDEK